LAVEHLTGFEQLRVGRLRTHTRDHFFFEGREVLLQGFEIGA